MFVPDLSLALLAGENELDLGLCAVGEHGSGLHQDLVQVVVLHQVVGHPVGHQLEFLKNVIYTKLFL